MAAEEARSDPKPVRRRLTGKQSELRQVAMRNRAVELTEPRQFGRGVNGHCVYWICMSHPMPKTVERLGLKKKRAAIPSQSGDD